MKLLRSIRGKMILFYTGLILTLVITLSLLYYSYTSSILAERASHSLLQLSVNTNSNLDSLIQNVDSTAYRITSSSLIKEEFYKEVSTQQERLKNKLDMIDLLFTTTGAKVENTINIIGQNRKLVEFGRHFDLSYLNSAEHFDIDAAIQNCLEKEGRMYISTTPLSPHYNNTEDTFLYICRSFNDTFGAPYDACVEIHLNYDTIEKLVDSSIGNEDTEIYIYDNSGNLIYPKAVSEPTPDYYESALNQSNHSNTFTIDSDNQTQLVAFSRSEYSNISVFACKNKNQVYLPVIGFRNLLLSVAIMIMLFTILIVSFLATQLTQPIHDLQKSINSLDLNRLDTTELPPPDKYSTYELENLSNAYKTMITRLQESLNEAVTARSREIESRMLALQAQMNPHFLYNTITVISIQAEDYQADKVVEMCENLTSMLRYVTKETDVTVSLKTELTHLKQYLFLMGCRYPEQFTAEISIPSEMKSLVVPKLIIQPLVENSFKHGFKSKQHWTLKIEGHSTETNWEISVSDNGSGFSEDALQQLKQSFSTAQGDFQSDAQDHVGLSNIFHRLKFLYKEQARFEIENLPEGGCRIIIGGETLQQENRT